MLERLTEIGLFLVPFALFVLWRLTWRRGGPSAAALLVALGALAVLAGGLIWFSHQRSLPPHSVYVPAQLDDGRIVPGHGGR